MKDEEHQSSAPLHQHRVVQEISRLLAAHAQEWFGTGAAVSGPPAVDERTWSYLMRYEVLRPAAAAAARVIVKVPREPGLASLGAAVTAEHWRRATVLEFATLQAVAQVVARHEPDGLCAVRPLAHFADCNALVMEELPSTTLKSRLLDRRTLARRSSEWRRVEVLLTRAGAWLRLFHDEVGECAQEPFPVEQTRADVRGELARLAAVLGPDDGLRALAAGVEEAVDALQGAEVATATLHGDYNCMNVLVGPDDCIASLDMNEGVRAPVYRDLATLVTDLLTRKAFVLAFGFTRQAPRARAGTEAVLRGYFGQQPHHARALDLACVQAVLGKWRLDEEAAEAHRSVRGLLAVPLRVAFRRYYRRLALAYLRGARSV